MVSEHSTVSEQIKVSEHSTVSKQQGKWTHYGEWLQ